jgi:hypothetical protein
VSRGGPEGGVAPIPPGTFRIDREGVWLHEGVEVTHPGVLRNLYASLRVEGDAHHLQLGPVRVPVEVADAPFVVERVDVDRDAAVLRAHLSDRTVEALDPASLVLDARGVPYCRVKAGRFRARLSVAAWLQLAAHAEVDPASGRATLAVGARRVPLPGPGERPGA